MTLMLEPPPSTLPTDMGRLRPLRSGLGSAAKLQSVGPPRFSAQRAAAMTLGTSSLPPASSRRTCIPGFSASLRATTDPDDPAPQTITSYAVLRAPVAYATSTFIV